MSKSKLTLYMPEEISRLAHRIAKLTGKSISTMVKEFFIKEEKKAKSTSISPSVSKWIGALEANKSYKELRDELTEAELKKYENIS